MKPKILSLGTSTSNKWVNLFDAKYVNSKGKKIDWTFASRKGKVVLDEGLGNRLFTDQVDAVVIVPIVERKHETKIVLVKEYRVAVDAVVYDFPAGLVEPGRSIAQTVEEELKQETGLNLDEIEYRSPLLFSSPGLTDESCVMAFVKASGRLSKRYQEENEDIEPVALGIKDLRVLMLPVSDIKWGAKAWSILFHYVQIGMIK